MSGFPVRPRRDCPSFRPGHQTHWIQARQSFTRYGHTRRAVEAVTVDDSGLLALAMPDGTVQHRWTHDPRFVRARLADLDRGPVQLTEPALLRIGSTLVSVCPVADIVRCPTEVDPDALPLMEQVDQLGGFSVPGQDLRAGG